MQEHEAEDLAQEVFLRLLSKNVLERADETRGRFRSFLLGLSRNVHLEHLRNTTRGKRGGKTSTVSLNVEDLSIGAPQDEVFDRLWLEQIINLALENLSENHPEHHRVLLWTVIEGLSQKEVGEKLGRKEDDVKNLMRRSRKLLRTALKEEIAAYCSSLEEYKQEVNLLSTYLDVS